MSSILSPKTLACSASSTGRAWLGQRCCRSSDTTTWTRESVTGPWPKERYSRRDASTTRCFVNWPRSVASSCDNRSPQTRPFSGRAWIRDEAADSRQRIFWREPRSVPSAARKRMAGDYEPGDDATKNQEDHNDRDHLSPG